VNVVEREGLRLLVFPGLEKIGLRCAISTVPLDVRRREQRARFVRAAGLDPERVASPGRQVHMADVARVTLAADAPAEGDGLVTDTPALALVLRAADCSLVVVADPEHRAVGVVHAGWKGSARGIVVNLVKAMHTHFRSRPAELYAGVGPTIRAPRYEVGPEVPAAFFRSRAWTSEHVEARDGKLHYDLPGANAHFLRECGIPRKHIEESPLCTFQRADLLHSFRRNGTDAGHHGLVAAWPYRPWHSVQ
jgi:YfiH family protein